MHGDLGLSDFCEDLIEGLYKQVGQEGQAQWNLAGHGH